MRSGLEKKLGDRGVSGADGIRNQRPPIPEKEGSIMKRSVLEGKQILAVDDDPLVLQILEQKIVEAGLNCMLDKAMTYIQAVEMMVSLTYDLVILDITEVRGFDLLNLTVLRNFPAAVLARKPLNPDTLMRSIEMGARAYLPKDKLGEIIPFLEDMLTHRYQSGRKSLLEKTKGFFVSAFGPNSEPGIASPWKEWPSAGCRSNSY